MDKAALESELDELYVVRRKLQTGKNPESVSHGDRRVQYTAANLPDVEARIRTIESQLGINQENARRAYGIHLG